MRITSAISEHSNYHLCFLRYYNGNLHFTGPYILLSTVSPIFAKDIKSIYDFLNKVNLYFVLVNVEITLQKINQLKVNV